MPKVLSLDKSLTVLEAVFQSREGVGTRTLARQLDLNVATIHNIAMTFCRRDYLRQDPGTKHFLPGMRMMLLGRHPSYLRSLVASVGGIVDDLAEKINESVLLGAIDMGHVLNLKYIPGRRSLRVHEPEDMSDHAHCTGFGKVLLSTFTEDELEIYLRETPLRQFTARTICQPEALRRELQKVREQGYARTEDEYDEGVSAVAIPIRNPWGTVIASLGASAPTMRLGDAAKFASIREELQHAVTRIEAIWGDNLKIQGKPSLPAKAAARPVKPAKKSS